MRRRVSLLFAAVATAAFLYAPQGAASADPPPARSLQWRQLASAALDKFETYDKASVGGALSVNGCGPGYPGVTQRVAAYAWAAEASGRLRGWDDPRTGKYLARMLSMKNPDGGYGLPCDYDQFNDGSVNPKTTSYTVTMAGHVGPTEIEAYKHGALSGAELKALAAEVKAVPQLNTPAGTCIAYTPAAADQKPAYCVHNVSAGAAVFLLQAQAAGQGVPGVGALAAYVGRRETATYSVYTGSWPYDDSGRVSDDGHTAYLVQSMYYLAPQLGNLIAGNLMAKTYTSADWGVPIGLTALPSAVGGIPTGAPDRWCVAGEKFLPIQRQAVDAMTGAANATGMAQAAQLFAVAADACAPFDPPVTPPTTPTTPATTAPTPSPSPSPSSVPTAEPSPTESAPPIG